MSTSIVEFIYGPNSNLMALRQPWYPSLGNYPADTTEGIVYLAEDDGVVSGEFYKTGESIIYSGGSWVSLGGGGIMPADAVGFLANDGTGNLSWAESANFGEDWIVITNDYAVSGSKNLLVDSSAFSIINPLEITLPAAPALYTVVKVSPVYPNYTTCPVLVLANGSNIAGQVNDVLIDQNDLSVEFIFVGGTIGWALINRGDSLYVNSVGVPPQWQVITDVDSPISAVAGDAFLADTTNGVILINLPAGPSLYASVKISPLQPTYSINPVTVQSATEAINGGVIGVGVDIDQNNLAVEFVFVGGVVGWAIISGGQSATINSYPPLQLPADAAGALLNDGGGNLSWGTINGFDPTADQTITGEWNFNLSGNKDFYVSSVPLANIGIDSDASFFGLLDHNVDANSTAKLFGFRIANLTGNNYINSTNMVDDNGDCISYPFYMNSGSGTCYMNGSVSSGVSGITLAADNISVGATNGTEFVGQTDQKYSITVGEVTANSLYPGIGNIVKPIVLNEQESDLKNVIGIVDSPTYKGMVVGPAILPTRTDFTMFRTGIVQDTTTPVNVMLANFLAVNATDAYWTIESNSGALISGEDIGGVRKIEVFDDPTTALGIATKQYVDLNAVTTASTGMTIDFASKKVFYTRTAPSSAGIFSENLTGAKLGVVQKIYHNAGSVPTFPGTWTLIGVNTYSVGVLNIIYVEWTGAVSGVTAEYWIVQG